MSSHVLHAGETLEYSYKDISISHLKYLIVFIKKVEIKFVSLSFLRLMKWNNQVSTIASAFGVNLENSDYSYSESTILP